MVKRYIHKGFPLSLQCHDSRDGLEGSHCCLLMLDDSFASRSLQENRLVEGHNHYKSIISVEAP